MVVGLSMEEPPVRGRRTAGEPPRIAPPARRPSRGPPSAEPPATQPRRPPIEVVPQPARLEHVIRRPVAATPVADRPARHRLHERHQAALSIDYPDSGSTTGHARTTSPTQPRSPARPHPASGPVSAPPPEKNCLARGYYMRSPRRGGGPGARDPRVPLYLAHGPGVIPDVRSSGGRCSSAAGSRRRWGSRGSRCDQTGPYPLVRPRMGSGWRILLPRPGPWPRTPPGPSPAPGPSEVGRPGAELGDTLRYVRARSWERLDDRRAWWLPGSGSGLLVAAGRLGLPASSAPPPAGSGLGAAGPGRPWVLPALSGSTVATFAAVVCRRAGHPLGCVVAHVGLAPL